MFLIIKGRWKWTLLLRQRTNCDPACFQFPSVIVRIWLLESYTLASVAVVVSAIPRWRTAWRTQSSREEARDVDRCVISLALRLVPVLSHILH